jgi:arsenate reductase
MTYTIYHNPKCSKSRQTLALLEEKGIQPQVVLYLQDVPNENTLAILLKQLGCTPQEMFRFKEDLAKELGLSKNDQRSEKEWLKILAQHIRLMERPIVSDGKRAVFGRPPENVLSLIR